MKKMITVKIKYVNIGDEFFGSEVKFFDKEGTPLSLSDIVFIIRGDKNLSSYQIEEIRKKLLTGADNFFCGRKRDDGFFIYPSLEGERILRKTLVSERYQIFRNEIQSLLEKIRNEAVSVPSEIQEEKIKISPNLIIEIKYKNVGDEFDSSISFFDQERRIPDFLKLISNLRGAWDLPMDQKEEIKEKILYKNRNVSFIEGNTEEGFFLTLSYYGERELQTTPFKERYGLFKKMIESFLKDIQKEVFSFPEERREEEIEMTFD